MTLKFEVTEADFLAFQEHFRKTSPVIKRQRRIVTLVAIAAVFAWIFVLTARHGVLPALFSAFIGGVLIYLWTLVVYRFAPKLNRGLYKTAAQDASGIMEVEVSPQGLRTKSKRGESNFYWDSIGDIKTTPEHTFIYIGKMQGIIIPQRRIVSGNYAAFMQALADIYAHRRDTALQTASPTAAAVPAVPAPVTATTDATTENEQVIVGNRHATDR